MQYDRGTINPPYIYGLIPFIYIAESLQLVLYISAMLVVLFLLCMLTVHLCRDVILYNNKYLFFALISTAWVSIFSLLLEAWFYPFKQSLAVYLFILPMNTTLVCCLDDCLHRQHRRLCKPAIICAAGALLFALLRELLSTGAVQLRLPFARPDSAVLCVLGCDVQAGISLFAYSAGGLLLAGVLLAIFNKLTAE